MYSSSPLMWVLCWCGTRTSRWNARENCYNRAEQNYNNPHWHRTSWNNSGELELADPYSTAGKPPTGRLKIPFLLIKYVTFNAFLPKNMHLNFHNRQRKARQKEFVCLNSLLFAHFSHFSLRVCELRSRSRDVATEFQLCVWRYAS